MIRRRSIALAFAACRLRTDASLRHRAGRHGAERFTRFTVDDLRAFYAAAYPAGERGAHRRRRRDAGRA